MNATVQPKEDKEVVTYFRHKSEKVMKLVKDILNHQESPFVPGHTKSVGYECMSNEYSTLIKVKLNYMTYDKVFWGYLLYVDVINGVVEDNVGMYIGPESMFLHPLDDEQCPFGELANIRAGSTTRNVFDCLRNRYDEREASLRDA